jgi:hypothetical protein
MDNVLPKRRREYTYKGKNVRGPQINIKLFPVG